MIVSWDTSALVKLLVDEGDAEIARQLWRARPRSIAATLVVPEAASALARLRRDGAIDATNYDRAARGLTRLLERLHLLDLTPARAIGAAQLIADHHLRGADAVHIAVAVEAVRRGSEVVIATWDRQVHAAAINLGLAPVPERIQPR